MRRTPVLALQPARVATLCVLVFLLAAFAPPASRAQERPEAERPPNVVLIMADDLGWETLESYGSTSYETPNLSALAASGMRFTQAYSTPLCTPSRVRIMTGDYTARNYETFGRLPSDETTFANLLREAGYATAIAGKWQLHGGAQAPHEFGFDEYLLWQLAPGDFWRRYKNPIVSRSDAPASPPDTLHGQYGPDVFTRFLTGFIEEHASEPFLVYYPMVLPHRPFQPTPATGAFDTFEIRGADDPAYFGDMVAYMDRLVGRIVQKLEALGLRENTLVIFTGDNGTHHRIYSRMGARVVQGDKGYPTEAGTHVPLLASWPGTVAADRTSSALIDFADVLPTLAEAAGVDSTRYADTDGMSFFPTLVEGRRHPRARIYQDYPGKEDFPYPPRRWVQGRRYKLYADGRFYDMTRDPEEHADLSGRSLSDRARAAKKRLQKVLVRRGSQRNSEARGSQAEESMEATSEKQR
jgi:arylsulfatase A-like enzyme